MYNYIVAEDTVVREYYACSHRYTDVAIKAGSYPLERVHDEGRQKHYWKVDVPGIIVSSDYSNRWFGQVIGKLDNIDTDVDEITTVRRFFDEGFYLDNAIRKGFVVKTGQPEAAPVKASKNWSDKWNCEPRNPSPALRKARRDAMAARQPMPSM